MNRISLYSVLLIFALLLGCNRTVKTNKKEQAEVASAPKSNQAKAKQSKAKQSKAKVSKTSSKPKPSVRKSRAKTKPAVSGKPRKTAPLRPSMQKPSVVVTAIGEAVDSLLKSKL